LQARNKSEQELNMSLVLRRQTEELVSPEPSGRVSLELGTTASIAHKKISRAGVSSHSGHRGIMAMSLLEMVRDEHLTGCGLWAQRPEASKLTRRKYMQSTEDVV
jgi:hypothetical protein